VRDVSLEDLAERAAAGDAKAADALVRALLDEVYGLALRMLWHPEDAEDATQEILVKVLTHLSTFRRESALRTWVFRVAANHLLSTRRSRLERTGLSFEALGEDLARGLDEPRPPSAADADQGVLAEEIKIGCTQAMLLCLDRDQRIAYVLGDVLELESELAAAVVGIEPAAFRKRLERAREEIRGFMQSHCGLVNTARPCRCARRIGYAVRSGRVEPHNLLFTSPEIRAGVAEMESLHDEAAAVFRTQRHKPAPESLVVKLSALIHGKRYPAMLD
jgi:RNA polymerase sigma factor (sigma-70 family)